MSIFYFSKRNFQLFFKLAALKEDKHANVFHVHVHVHV